MFIELYGRESEPGCGTVSSASEPYGYLRNVERGAGCGIERQLPPHGRYELPDQITVRFDLRMAPMPCGKSLRIAQRRVDKEQFIYIVGGP